MNNSTNISELPVGTTISVVHDEDRYEKLDGDIWSATFTENDTFSSKYLEKNYSDKIRIISMPFGVVWQMAIMLADEYGSVDSEGEDITFQGIINDAVGEYNDMVERDAKKARK